MLSGRKNRISTETQKLDSDLCHITGKNGKDPHMCLILKMLRSYNQVVFLSLSKFFEIYLKKPKAKLGGIPKTTDTFSFLVDEGFLNCSDSSHQV